MSEEQFRYRILIVDDNSNDAALMVRTLKKADMDITELVVSDRQEYARAVEEFEPDVVLTDYQLPSFNGSDAMRTLHTVRPLVPAIIVTGSLGDERAAELVREGAADYILKGNLHRLPVAVKRVIRESEQRHRQNQAEREAEAQGTRLSQLFAGSMDGIVVLDARGEIVDANPAAAELLGYASEELIGTSWAELVADTEEIPGSLRNLNGSDDKIRRYLAVRRKNGEHIDLDVTLTVEHQSDGAVFGFVIFRDVTDQLRMEHELRRERELQTVLRIIAHKIAPDGKEYPDLAEPLEVIRQFIGWPLAHLYALDRKTGMLESTLVWCGEIDSDLKAFVEGTERYSFESGEGLIGEVFETSASIWIEDLDEDSRFRRRDLARNVGLRSAVACPVMADGQPAAVIELFSRNTESVNETVVESFRLIGHEMGRLFERMQFDQFMRERQWELETLVQNAPDIILRTDEDRRIKLVSPAISLFGISVRDVVGLTLSEAASRYDFSQDAVRQITELSDLVWNSGKPESLEWNIDIDGRKVHLHTIVSPEFDDRRRMVSILSITRDISEQAEMAESLKRSQKQLQHAQRLESVGRLAGGVAHDFNNILTAMNGYLFLIRQIVTPESKIGGYIEHVNSAAERAARLTQQLLLFSRRAPSEMGSIEVNKIVNEMMKMLSRLIGENIQLTTRLTDESTRVTGDAGKLEQVVMNLVINARDAMPDGGSIVIKTNRERERLPYQSDGNSREVDVVRMSVRDTGTGMDEETKARIFEPFFTTKGRERGSGLGLSVVFGIVEEHGGTVSVKSAPGKGSTFHLLIPAAGSAESSEADRNSEYPVGVEAPGIHLLLVEDDEEIRQMVHRVLSRNGIQVEVAATLGEAERVVSAGKGVDIVVADIVLPDGSGAELPGRLGLDVPYVFSSGYLEDRSDMDRIRGMGFPFLQKPYDISTLVSTVNEVLRGEGQ